MGRPSHSIPKGGCPSHALSSSLPHVPHTLSLSHPSAYLLLVSIGQDYSRDDVFHETDAPLMTWFSCN